MSILPLPLTTADRDAGYWWELSMRQVETSRTVVFDAPRARGFFEALVGDNLASGPPRPRRGDLRRPPPTVGSTTEEAADLPDPHRYPGHDRDHRQCRPQTLPDQYKHSRIKQYLKDGRAPRIETVINDPGDLGCKRRLVHLDQLQSKARAINNRLLDTERVGQGCVLASPAFERVARSTLTEDARRSPALRFGDPRVMALLGALCRSERPRIH